jgi:ABC-2 type transport system permease protein
MATLVNSRGWSSSANAMTLAGIWLVLVAIVPSVLNVVISTVHPLPSRIALVEAAREAQSRALTHIGQRTAIDLDERARSSLLQIMEAEAEVAPVLRRFDEQLDKQQAQVQRWRWLSPAVMTQLTLTQIAETDGERYKRFAAATERFRTRWRYYLLPIYPRQFSSSDVEGIPRFTFVEAGPGRYSTQTAFVLFAAYAAAIAAAIRFVERVS